MSRWPSPQTKRFLAEESRKRFERIEEVMAARRREHASTAPLPAPSEDRDPGDEDVGRSKGTP